MFIWVFVFYGLSNFEGFFNVKSIFYANIQFFFKQFSLAWVHSLIIKDISISSYSVYSNSSNSANSV